MSKKERGQCDFCYLRGPKKGRVCGREGTKDVIGYRCERHKHSRIITWHRMRDSTATPFRIKYEMLLTEVLKLQQCFRAIEALAAVQPKLDKDNS